MNVCVKLAQEVLGDFKPGAATERLLSVEEIEQYYRREYNLQLVQFDDALNRTLTFFLLIFHFRSQLQTLSICWQDFMQGAITGTCSSKQFAAVTTTCRQIRSAVSGRPNENCS
jgi:hypothetical protein